MTDSARSDQEHRKLYQQFVDNYFSRVHLLNRAFSLKQEPSVVLRRIAEEKIEIAFDEFEIEVRIIYKLLRYYLLPLRLILMFK